MMSRKIGGFVVAGFAAYFAITNPTEAAGIVRTIAGGIAAFASAVVGGAG
jgi:hypothetical protein